MCTVMTIHWVSFWYMKCLPDCLCQVKWCPCCRTVHYFNHSGIQWISLILNKNEKMRKQFSCSCLLVSSSRNLLKLMIAGWFCTTILVLFSDHSERLCFWTFCVRRELMVLSPEHGMALRILIQRFKKLLIITIIILTFSIIIYITF